MIEASTDLRDEKIRQLRIKIFADGADRNTIVQLAENPVIKGFTTNPTLMHKAGITDYEQFARDLLELLPSYPFSFEVFADENEEMLRQARRIATWGPNVYVKIPVTNTNRDSTRPVYHALALEGVKVNVTAVMTVAQVRTVVAGLSSDVPACISVFAGRIADTGVDPVPIMREAIATMSMLPKAELIWASPRELLNIFHAEDAGVHIVTVTSDILGKLSLVGMDLDDYSLATVRMFARDAAAAKFHI